MKKPTVSIIIPVYNQAKKIRSCLKSVFNQTIKDLEVIVINDGSKDKLLPALRPWQTKIKLINQKNQGAPAARNAGFALSQGDYVIFCDADVAMKPQMIETMLEALRRHRQAAYAYSSFKFGWKKFKLWRFDAGKLKQMPYIHTTSLMRREFFPGFDPRLKKFQDWDLWLSILEKGGEGVWLDEVLFTVDSGGTMSRWLPKFFYRLPFLSQVKKYRQAKEIIKNKHRL